jgi:hypothetical protein
MPDKPDETREQRDDEGLKQPAEAVKDLDVDEENEEKVAGGNTKYTNIVLKSGVDSRLET